MHKQKFSSIDQELRGLPRLDKPTVVLGCDFSDRFKGLLAESSEILPAFPDQNFESVRSELTNVQALIAKGGIKQN